MTIEVLTKPSCVQCTATYRALDNKGMDYEIKDLSQDSDALAQAKDMGYLQAPVVLIRDAANNIIDHWSGFRPEKIAQHA